VQLQRYVGLGRQTGDVRVQVSAVAGRPAITAADLAGLHTKVLLRALRQTTARNSSQHHLIERICDTCGIRPSDVTQEMVVAHRQVVDDDLLGGTYGAGTSTVTVEQLRAELARRLHVPNKQESRILRREKNERGRGRGRCDR